jgi:heat-inducible transcriptional repressor
VDTICPTSRYSLIIKYLFEYKIQIGRENEIDSLKNCSLVTVTYKMGDKNLGSIGVIGPTRMQYSKVLSILHYMGRSLSEILTDVDGRSLKEQGE